MALSVISVMMLFAAACTIASIVVKRELGLGALNIKFVLGGLLLSVRGGVRARVKFAGKQGGHYLIPLASMVIGVALFYLYLVPLVVNMIGGFIKHLTGTSPEAPAPVIVPLPLLLTYESLVKYLLTGLVTGVTFHELAHALMALKRGISVKSWGLGLLLLFPLAFVELDEDEFKRASPWDRALVASAGPFANAVLASATLLLMLLLPQILATMGTLSSAVLVTGLSCDICEGGSECPALRLSLRPGSVLYALNGTRLYDVNDVVEFLRRLQVGSTVTLTICDKTCRNVSLLLDSYNERLYNRTGALVPCLGLEMRNSILIERGGAVIVLPWLQELYSHLNFAFMINVGLYIFNAIPFVITDGTLFIKALAEMRPKLRLLVEKRILDFANLAVIAVAMAISMYIALMR